MRPAQPTPSAIARPLIALLVTVFVTVAAVGVVPGQSGRRLPKNTDSKRTESAPKSVPDGPPPLPPTAAESKAESKPQEPKKEPSLLSVFVAYDKGDFEIPMHWPQYAAEGCAGRLGKSRAVTVKIGRDMNRKEAHDRAKSEKDTYVVWLEVAMDRHSPSSGAGYYPELWVTFTVFAPVTGKSKTSGRAYLRRYTPSVGGVPVPVPSGRVAIEHLIKQAGEDVADRVIDALQVNVPVNGPVPRP